MPPRIGICALLVLVLGLALDRQPLGAAEMAENLALIQVETAAWEAWKTGDEVFFESHVDEQGLLITSDGRRIGKAAAVEEIAEGVCDVASFELSNFHVHSLAADTKILSYQARQDAVCDGKRVPEYLLVSSVYDRVEGKWVNVHYQETVRREDDEAR